MASENDLALLEAYGNELDLHGTLTLKSLIDSHRNLRALALQTHEERRTEVQRGFDRGFEMGTQHALTNRYLSREDLRKMTVAELAAALYEDSDA